ncbi:hypothetical protein OUZ56_032781 [Daphnia magna]|uniref:Uncharacterized protein n=1 Tax=Daphnia magna TaxID=35525 RepID=A0ABQ9ZXT1_9CRUS|nr:hypothetical protein OUZ56_032781 [Daphnia magna]
MEGNPNLQVALLSSVNVFSQNPTSNSSGKHVVIEITWENTSLIDTISEILKRNDRARLAAHEHHDVVSLLPRDRGREELEMENLVDKARTREGRVGKVYTLLFFFRETLKCIAPCRKVHRAVGYDRSESPQSVSESRRDD